MDAFISALTAAEGGINAATFFGPLTSLVPFLKIMIPVALGYYIVRRAIKKAGNKGKVSL